MKNPKNSTLLINKDSKFKENSYISESTVNLRNLPIHTIEEVIKTLSRKNDSFTFPSQPDFELMTVTGYYKIKDLKIILDKFKQNKENHFICGKIENNIKVLAVCKKVQTHFVPCHN